VGIRGKPRCFTSWCHIPTKMGSNLLVSMLMFQPEKCCMHRIYIASCGPNSDNCGESKKGILEILKLKPILNLIDSESRIR